MKYTAMTQKKVHEGRNVKRFREMLGIKQDALAYELGEDWSQKKISQLEQKESVDLALLERISDVLKIPVDAFKNFDEEQAINIIANTINNNDNAIMHGPAVYSHQPTFNPMDKLVEAYEEIKRLNIELLKEKDEKIRLLEKMLEGK